MLDEAISQYLKTRGEVAPPGSLFSSTSRPVTGVSLHIEASGGESGYSMVLRKDDAPVVEIGRRPGSQAGKTETGKAFFSCPVVSRQHAKLVFSDSGAVYLVDSTSHHGTHLRKKHETLFSKLSPEAPTLLADGDTITFGKSVSSDNGLVRPVVARVALLYAPLKPLVVPAVRPGRYGVSSDSDSDIEEVPGLSSRPPWHDTSPFDIDSFYEDGANEENSDFSRSSSSMDLSSSREPSPFSKENLAPAIEPIIIGAWPRSRSSSPFPPVRILPPAAVVTPNVDELESPVGEDSDDEVVIVEKDKPDKASENTETAQFKQSLDTLKAEVVKLNAHRRKYKQRFNDNIKVMNDKFSDLEERTTEISDIYHCLSDKVDENIDACQQAQVQIDVLQLDMLQSRMIDAPEKDAESPHAEEANANAKAIQGLVAEMTELRNTVRKDMVAELQGMREAKDTFQSLSEQVREQLASLKQIESLKRKRCDDETEAGPSAVAVEPPRKRARQVAAVLARTATATAVGAVVCWSALAFS